MSVASEYDLKILLIPVATNIASLICEKGGSAKQNIIERKKAIKELEEEINNPLA